MDTTERIRHRLRSHRAALRIAASLGEPAKELLGPTMHDTEVRIDEAAQILAIVEDGEQ